MWSTEVAAPTRTHLELRHVPSPLRQQYHAGLEDAATAMVGVHWARVNTLLGRWVVAHDAEVTAEDLEGVMDAVEDLLGLGHEPFDEVEHPADEEPIRRTRFERRVDAAAMAGGVGLRFSRLKRLPLEVDIAAALTALEGVPQARKWVVEIVGEPIADLGMSVGAAAANTLLKGPAGPLVDGLRRSLRLRELTERRALFAALEPELCAHPSQHEPRIEDPGARPAEMPLGPIERYVDKAIFAAAGGFGLGLASTGSVSSATASLFGGIPRPAQLGREAFAAQLGRELTARGLLVMRTDALRRVDRIDALVVTDDLVVREEGTGRLSEELLSLLGTARREGLRTVISTDDDRASARLGTVEVEPGGHGALLAVRRLQREGHAVLVVSGRSCPALAAADVGVGLSSGEGPPAWGADILARAGFGDAMLLVRAVAMARAASEHSVRIAVADAAMSLVLSLTGLGQKNVAKVMTAAQAASLMAMANAVRLARAAGRVPVPPPRDRTPWHALPSAEVLDLLGSTKEGLSTTAVATRTPVRAASRGQNAATFGRLLIDEIANPLTPILAGGRGCRR